MAKSMMGGEVRSNGCERSETDEYDISMKLPSVDYGGTAVT